jgi:hypothetical protein
MEATTSFATWGHSGGISGSFIGARHARSVRSCPDGEGHSSGTPNTLIKLSNSIQRLHYRNYPVPSPYSSFASNASWHQGPFTLPFIKSVFVRFFEQVGSTSEDSLRHQLLRLTKEHRTLKVT